MMDRRFLRRQKSDWAILGFYAIGFGTISIMVSIFVCFFLYGFIQLLRQGVAPGLIEVIVATFFVFAKAYLWVIPWAFILAVFCLSHRGSLLANLVLTVLKSYIRMPSVVVGVVVLALLSPLSLSSPLSWTIGFIVLPHMVYGWVVQLYRTPESARDAALSVGLSFEELFYHVYLVRNLVPMIKHGLKVTGVSLGLVAPVVYLTDFSGVNFSASTFLSLDIFREVIRGQGGSSFVWSAILLLSFMVIVLTAGSEDV